MSVSRPASLVCFVSDSGRTCTRVGDGVTLFIIISSVSMVLFIRVVIWYTSLILELITISLVILVSSSKVTSRSTS